MPELVATATCTAHRAVIVSTDGAVTERVLVARVAWLNTLIQAMAGQVIAQRWTPADLDQLASETSADGRVLPGKGWMAVRRWGWGAAAREGVYVCDRVRRGVDEEAARALRLALHRRGVVAAITATWPQHPGKRTGQEWKNLRGVLPDGVMLAEIRNRTRHVRAHLESHGVLPGDVTDLEAPPKVASQALLSAADKQFVTLHRVSETTAVLRVQLPLKATPATSRDWAWHIIAVTLPPNVPADARLCTPTLRVVKHRVRVDLPFKTPVPFVPAAGHTTALGFDWGVNTLLTGTAGRLVGGRVVSDGRMLRYDATEISAKLHRLRQQREALAAKRDQYTRLATGLTSPNPRQAELQQLHARVDIEHAHVCAKIRHLNDALAWSAPRWAVDQANATGASVIYLEDLTTLQARGSRKGNARLSGQVRGRVTEAIRHLAKKAAIAVVTIPAWGTSKYCPRCGNATSTLTHTLAPDRPGERGWKWSICRCGLSADRDRAAAERIVSRGLLAQAHTLTDRTTATPTIRTVAEGNIGRARRKTHPTRKARRANHTDHDTFARPDRVNKDRPTAKRPTQAKTSTTMTSPRMPDRRTAPAPPPQGQRPAGQAPQTSRRTAARSGLARDCQHRTGFHRAHATPVIALTADFGPSVGKATPTRIV